MAIPLPGSGFINRTAAITSSLGSLGSQAAATAASGPVFVDLSTQAIRADVVREGYRVPAAKVDRARADFLVGELVAVTKRDEPRIISQSVAAGTSVPAGTVVNLILTPRSNVPFEIFEGVHEDLMDRTVDEFLEGPLKDPSIREKVLRFENASEVPQEIRSQLVSAFQSSAIGINEAQPGTSFEAAFNGARAALAFR
jgi:hypothetical protein